MNFDSDLADTTLRLQILPASGSVFEARVEAVDGKRVQVTSECALKVGAAVQLDGSDRMLLGEVLSFERTEGGTRALVDVQRYLLYGDVEQTGPRSTAAHAADSRTDLAGA